MRVISPNILTLLAQERIESFYLIKVITPFGNLMDTTASFDIGVPTIGMFSANGNILSVDAPSISNVTDRASYKITYMDPAFEKRTMFEQVLTGSAVTVYIGFFNTTAGILGGAGPGDPLLDKADLPIIYSGVVDTQGYAVDPDNGAVTAVIECSSPMASLGMVRSLYTSKDSLKQRHATDTAFDQVYVGSRQLAYLWGKP